MRKLLLIALLPLAGCVTPGPQARGPSPQQVMAEDPTTACMKRLETDPFIVRHLSEKMGIGRPGAASIEMLSDKSTPSDEQRQALSAYGAARQQCISLGSAYRRSNMPSYAVDAMEQGGQRITLLLAKLYAGDMSFGEFNTARLESGNRTRADLRDGDRQSAQAQADIETRDRAERGAALQNFQNQLLLQQQIRNQQIQQNKPYNTTCQRWGNRVECTTQ